MGEPTPQQQTSGLYREKLDALLAVCRNNLKDLDEDLITKAFDFAVYAHKDHPENRVNFILRIRMRLR